MEARFIADVHLGKLARLLRLLGFDTVYKNNYTLEQLLKISTDQERILLSRNQSISKQTSSKIFIVSSENPFVQMKQLVDYFDLKNQFLPFSKCIACNGILEQVSKKNIIALLEERTSKYYNDFWQCKDCKHIYWKGSYYEKMLKTIENITSR